MSLLKFNKVEDPSGLLLILKSRHPFSCFMQNQVTKYDGFKNGIAFYTIGDELGPNTWIISKHIRRDYGSHISISAPTAIVEGNQEIDSEIKKLLASGGNVIDWDNGLKFVALEKVVSKMILEISVDLKGNVSKVHPCHLYYMEIEEALNLKIKTPSLSVEVRKLNAAKPEEVNFIVSNWAYSLAGTEHDIGLSIHSNVSGGVFVEGKCVSGVYCPGMGVLSALYTSKQERGKGYGKLAMRFALQQSAKENCIPCCCVEQRNVRSIGFTEATGLKLASVVDWIVVTKLDID